MELSRDGQAINSVEEWFAFAAPLGGRFQWRDGYSAKELAKSWCRVTGRVEAPQEFTEFLARIPGLQGLRIVSGHPEHRVAFDGVPGQPRNADLVLRCESAQGVVAVSVEAKARETFGLPVYEVMGNAARKWSDETASNYITRLEELRRGLFRSRRPGAPRLGELRYQLLTAAGGALAYAREVGAGSAVLIVHEFRPPDVEEDDYADNARDLKQFIHRLGGVAPAPVSDLWGPFRVPGNARIPGHVPLHIGKLISACDPVHPLP